MNKKEMFFFFEFMKIKPTKCEQPVQKTQNAKIRPTDIG